MKKSIALISIALILLSPALAAEKADNYEKIVKFGEKVTIQPPVEVRPDSANIGINAKKFDESVEFDGYWMVYDNHGTGLQGTAREERSRQISDLDMWVHVCDVRHEGDVGDIVFTRQDVSTEQACAGSTDSTVTDECSIDIRKAGSYAEGRVCTQQVQTLSCPYGDKTYQARNGCEISYLKERGWTEGGSSLTCPVAVDSRVVVNQDSNDNSRIDDLEVTKAVESWRKGDISNEELQKVKFAWKNDCDIGGRNSDPAECRADRAKANEYERQNQPCRDIGIRLRCTHDSSYEYSFNSCEAEKLEQLGWERVSANGSDPSEPAPTPSSDKSTIDLHEGWNMISSASGFRVSDLADDCELADYSGHISWQYLGGWKHPDAIRSAEGTYVWSSESCTTEVSPLTSDQSELEPVMLSEGWNMISVPREMNLKNVKGCEFKAFKDYVAYHYGADGWQMHGLSKKLDPGKGYYVYAKSSCSMDFDFVTEPPTPEKGRLGKFLDGLTSWMD